MALRSAYVEITPGTASYSGIGFRPTALLFLSTINDLNTSSQSARMMIGAATGPSNQFVGSYYSSAGEAINHSAKELSSVDCLHFISSGAEVYAAQLVEFTADGFTLSWTGTPNSGHAFQAIAIGGASFHAGAWRSDSGTYTGIPFKPQGMLCVSTDSTQDASVPSLETGADFSSGIAVDDGIGGITNLCLMEHSGYNQNTDPSVTRRGISNDSCLWTINDSLVTSFKMSISSLTADGFVPNTISGGPSTFGFLVFGEFGEFKALTDTEPTAAGDKEYTCGFSPDMSFFASSAVAAYNTITNQLIYSIGLVTKDITNKCWFNCAMTNQVTKDATRQHSSDLIYNGTSSGNAPSLLAKGVFKAWTANGVEVTWSGSSFASRPLYYLALKDRGIKMNPLMFGQDF